MYDSLETERLVRLINNKKEYLKKQTNKVATQYLQKEIMFLENDILPIVLKNTTPIFFEIAKYAIICYEKAIKHKCNGLLCYLPIEDDYRDLPSIGVANCRYALFYGTPNALHFHSVKMVNKDGNPPEAINTIEIPIHDLINMDYGR